MKSDIWKIVGVMTNYMLHVMLSIVDVNAIQKYRMLYWIKYHIGKQDKYFAD